MRFERSHARRTAFVAVASSFALLATACGSGDDGSSGGGGSAAPALEGRGPITLASGKDTSGNLQNQLNAWNASHPTEKVELKELPEDANAQRQQMIQNAQAQSDAFSVLSMDVVWTSEFAANQWVTQIPEDKVPDLGKLIPATVETAKYRDKLYGVPVTSDGGLLYYRKDLLTKAGIADAPKTWDEMLAACQKVAALPEAKGMSCYAGQYEKYEGLTVNFAEAINSAGGVIVDKDGKPNVNTPEAKAGLEELVNGFKAGAIPKAAITYKEEEGRRAFQEGKLLFHRNWPYVYALANKTDGSSKVAGKFGVAPLPGKTGPGVSSLGGHDYAISSFAKNKATALDFINFMASEERQKANIEKTSQAPSWASLYDDPALTKQFPYLAPLKASILGAQPRPRVVKYGDVTAAIQAAAYDALNAKVAPDKALADLQTKLQSLITQ
ncbi:ABC transporter substrate-binding protein [Kribbella speibonae]|uniref:ABC transporter substrate-binding protein n=1 Tax=Kribbella speibonae TaxID=1572660 RepID=A0A4R0IRZ1_9ACTN|nr:ABC transporter substrate-binding protein [Kribbella speibonae]TCC27699.1 ABC transporter substrate-binding protein [Kribbella speibonae]TCC35440.1 ABC transporter substrate-binding protein [Kribbella speibonae]